MNPVRKWIRDLFGFAGNEINGFLILLPLMVALIFSEPVYRAWLANQPRGNPQDQSKLDSLIKIWGVEKTSLRTNEPVSPFLFDPNTAAVEELQAVGIPLTLARRIAVYRQRGGVFRLKSDFMKIYGLDSSLYQRLYPYLKLPAQRRSAHRQKYRPRSNPRPKKQGPFDINTADTTALKGIFGIGSKLAARIVRFREALGGFVKTDQLYEVYGLDSMVVKQLLDASFIKTGFVPLKININRADEKQLSAHPYIRYKIAHALVTFRFQHGDFHDVGDIKKLSSVGPEEIERLLPYITVSN